jgi:glycosyltransferase involved in cell wall biosynthesis
MRVCIVTPGALASNPRVVKEATTLAEAGYAVDVISTRTLEEVDALERDVVKAAKWHARRLDFRRRTGWQARRMAQEISLRLFALAGWKRLAERGFSPFTGALVAAARRIPADLYIAHYPAALPAAALAAKAHGAQYAFDAEDYHLGDLPEAPEHALHRHMVRAIEERYLPGCAYVTAASPGIADAYAAAYPIPRPTVVLNVFPLSQAPPGPAPRGTAEPGPSVYWFSQTIGPDRGLECAVRAIARAASRPHLYLRGTPARGYAERLRTLAAEAGAADRLHMLPPAPPADLERLAACYDVGYIGETGHTANRKIALTNKLFSYLLAGIPAVISGVPAHRAFAAEAGPAVRLFPVDDHDALAAALDSLLGDPAGLAAARAHAYALGQERYNWDVEKKRLIEAVAGTLRERRPAVDEFASPVLAARSGADSRPEPRWRR